MTRVYAAGKTAGKAIGTLAPVEADARRYLEMGATFVAVGSDLGVLRMGTQALHDKFRGPDAVPIAAQY
jgi:2-dehydro-3-deoxyglucarate aldolase